MDRIIQALTRIFDKHRIVFWYDAKKELRKEFEALSLPGISKVELNNNEFGIKYRVLREQPEQKFLVYHEGAQPEDINNWLLDVQLAHGEFRTDQAGIWLSELDLGPEFADIFHAHDEFFNAAKRREGLKRLLADDDTPGDILSITVRKRPLNWREKIRLMMDLKMPVPNLEQHRPFRNSSRRCMFPIRRTSAAFHSTHFWDRTCRVRAR